MADLTLGLQLLGDVVGPEPGVIVMALGAEGVHQVEVKILHTAGLQLTAEERQTGFRQMMEIALETGISV